MPGSTWSWGKVTVVTRHAYSSASMAWRTSARAAGDWAIAVRTVRVHPSRTRTHVAMYQRLTCATGENPGSPGRAVRGGALLMTRIRRGSKMAFGPLSPARSGTRPSRRRWGRTWGSGAAFRSLRTRPPPMVSCARGPCMLLRLVPRAAAALLAHWLTYLRWVRIYSVLSRGGLLRLGGWQILCLRYCHTGESLPLQLYCARLPRSAWMQSRIPQSHHVVSLARFSPSQGCLRHRAFWGPYPRTRRPRVPRIVHVR